VAENALQVEVRDAVGKGVARKLRAAGRIPAVCYGKARESVGLALDPNALRKLLDASDAGMNTIISLEGGGSVDGTMVLVKELQRDPVYGAYLHADFYTVDLEQRVEVSVPVHITGKAIGVEEGGVLDQALREIELSCLPLSIPKELMADVSQLDLGQSLHVRDIALPAGVELKSDPDLSVVSVVAPMKEEEEAVPEEGAEEGDVEAAESGEASQEEGADAPSEEKKGSD
jgi:large subunit ribosomal protein L25